ncbi:MAG: Ion transport 2 domain protein [Deltaproteobacteria bacterium]|nr:Ion transport 2 domain protein [Deltaproteobacteria bacterium]
MTTQYTRKAGLLRCINCKPVRFVQLFIFLILVILLTPLLDRTPLLVALLSLFFLNILIVSLSFVGYSVRRRWPLIVMWLLVTLFDWAVLHIGNISATMMISIASDIIRALLLIICVVLILRYVLTSHEVTLDTIFGALVAYFLIALAFSAIYQAVAVFEPSSFSISGMTDGGYSESLKMQFNYFSFVTIATVGYGDIVPRLPMTQMLAILEAVIGQFYMAGLITWLVSVFARRGKGA